MTLKGVGVVLKSESRLAMPVPVGAGLSRLPLAVRITCENTSGRYYWGTVLFVCDARYSNEMAWGVEINFKVRISI